MHARCLRFLLPWLALAAGGAAAERMTAPQLIELARTDPSRIVEAVRASFDAKRLTAGTAWASHGEGFFFATEAAARPALFIDGAPGPEMRRAGDSEL